MQRGSALLIVMVVITVISAIALTVIQFSIQVSRSAVRAEDSTSAYLLAAAGLEDGLLRWKFDRNIEAPLPFSSAGSSSQSSNSLLISPDCLTAPNSESTEFDRFSLTEKNIIPCIDSTNSPPRTNEMAYDIKVFHRLAPGRKECVGNINPGNANLLPNDICTQVANNTALSQDQVIEYDVSKISSVSINLNWKFGPQGPPQKVLLEVVSLGKDCLSSDNICNKKIYKLVDPNCSVVTRSCSASFSKDRGSNLRIKTFGSKLEYYVVSSSNPTDSLDTRFSEMDVIGYFGGVKRRLRLKLDRITGQALPLYDFALFAGDSDIGL